MQMTGESRMEHDFKEIRIKSVKLRIMRQQCYNVEDV